MHTIKKIIPIAFIAMLSMNAQAAFVVKNSKTQPVEQTTTASNQLSSSAIEVVSNDVKSLDNTESLMTAEAKGGGTAVSKGLYVVLAILGLGWLGMALNDDWKGQDWVISLVLYILFWLPGFIYTLVKMKNYYK